MRKATSCVRKVRPKMSSWYRFLSCGEGAVRTAAPGTLPRPSPSPRPPVPYPQLADEVPRLPQRHAGLLHQDVLHRLQHLGGHRHVPAHIHVPGALAQHPVHLLRQLRPQHVLHVGLGARGLR